MTEEGRVQGTSGLGARPGMVDEEEPHIPDLRSISRRLQAAAKSKTQGRQPQQHESAQQREDDPMQVRGVTGKSDIVSWTQAHDLIYGIGEMDDQDEGTDPGLAAAYVELGIATDGAS